MTLFYFWGISYNVSSFIYNCVNIGPLWFFFISLCKGLSIFLIFSRNQLLVLLIFSVDFLFLVYFCYNHYYSLPSANFELTLVFFFSSLRYKVRLCFSFSDLSIYFKYALIAINVSYLCIPWVLIFLSLFLLRYVLISFLI